MFAVIDPLEGLLPMDGTPGSSILIGIGIFIVGIWYVLNRKNNKDE